MAIDPTIALQTQVPQIQGPAQLLAQRTQIQGAQQEQALRGVELTQAQQGVQANKVLSDALQDPQAMTDQGGLKTYNVPFITQKLAAAGLGSQADTVGQHLSGLNGTAMQAYSTRLSLVRQGAQSIEAAGNDPTLASQWIDTQLRPFIGSQEADQYIAAIKKDPTLVPKLTSYFAGPVKPITLEPGSQAINPFTGQSVAAVPNKPLVLGPGGGVYQPPTPGATTTPSAGGATGTPAPNGGIVVPPRVKTDAVRVQYGGKQIYASRDPFTGKITDPATGKDITGEAIQTPPVQVQINGQINNALQNQPTWATSPGVGATGAAANVPDPKMGGLTPNGLYNFARKYLATGNLGWLRGTQEQVSLWTTAVNNKVGAMAAQMGMTADQFMGAYKANEASLTQQQKYADAASAFLSTADKNAAQLSAILPKVGDTGTPLFNKPLRVFQQQVQGNPTLSQFGTYLTSVQNEYGKILNNPNLSGQLTDSARHEAQALIDPKATVPQILASVQALNTEGTNRLQSIDEQLQKIMSRMGSGQVGTSGGPSNAPAGGGFIEATDPQGNTHHAPAGTPLPAGWKLVGGGQ